MVVNESNTVFPLITTHAWISAFPQTVAHHQGQKDKYPHPPISTLTLPPHFLKQIGGDAKRNLLALPVY